MVFNSHWTFAHNLFGWEEFWSDKWTPMETFDCDFFCIKTWLLLSIVNLQTFFLPFFRDFFPSQRLRKYAKGEKKTFISCPRFSNVEKVYHVELVQSVCVRQIVGSSIWDGALFSPLSTLVCSFILSFHTESLRTYIVHCYWSLLIYFFSRLKNFHRKVRQTTSINLIRSNVLVILSLGENCACGRQSSSNECSCINRRRSDLVVNHTIQ